MADLRNYLSLADLQPFFADPADLDSFPSDDWVKRWEDRINSIVIPKVIEFFKQLKAEGLVKPIPNSEGYRCRLWASWNGLANKDSEQAGPELYYLAEFASNNIVSKIVYPYEMALKKNAAMGFDKSANYENIIDWFNKGDFGLAEMFSRETCWETYMSLSLEFNNWSPVGFCRIGWEFQPIPKLQPATVVETVLTLKTGNLLVNDWFRIPEFAKVVKGDKHFALNSRLGMEEQTNHYAEQFNFISVGVGNSCAGVCQRGDQIVVGYHDEDDGMPDGLIMHGHVCTDLWAATLIEYENLVEIVSRELPDTAKSVVDDYLAEQSTGNYGVMSMTVTPGTYYLYHFGSHEKFAEMARAAGIDLGDTIDTPYFVLSRERLLKNI